MENASDYCDNGVSEPQKMVSEHQRNGREACMQSCPKSSHRRAICKEKVIGGSKFDVIKQ